MAEKKTEAEMPQTASTNTEPKKKKSTGKIILIVVLILLAIFLLCTVGGYFLARNFVVDTLKEIGINLEEEDISTTIPDEYDFFVAPDIDTDTQEEEVSESEYPAVDEDLDNSDLINREFNEDIPLPGGKVDSSRFLEGNNVTVTIHTSSNAEEAYNWYLKALEDEGWRITGQSRDEHSGSLEFDNGIDRNEEGNIRGNININDYQGLYGDFWNYTEISVREWTY